MLIGGCLPVKVVKIEKQPDLIFSKIIFRAAVPPGNTRTEKLAPGHHDREAYDISQLDVMSRAPGILS